jgi:guanine nucleotide-binding protein G(I)/G(S)/G(T) subunit beta-1
VQSMADLKAELKSLKDKLEKLRKDEHDLKASAEGKGDASLSLKTKRFLKGHFGKIYAMHWSAGQTKYLVSASQDGKLIVWNAHTTNKIQAIPLRSSWVMTCAYYASEGGNGTDMVACGGLDNLCSIYKLSKDPAPEQGRNTSIELAQHEGYLSCCRFRNEKEIITSSGDSSCIQWDIERNKPVSTFSDHTGDVMSVSLCPESNSPLFVSGSCDSTAKLWDTRVSHAVASFVGHESDINSVSFTFDGNAFGTGSDDSSCRMYSIKSFKQIADFASERILCGITSVAFSHSGRFLFGGYDNYNCYAWDTLTGNYVQELSGHENRVSSLGVSPNHADGKGSALCTGSWDTLLRVWA